MWSAQSSASKNNGTRLFKGLCQKESWETFKAVRRNWLSFRDSNEAGERAVMWGNVTVWSLEAEKQVWRRWGG